MAVGTGQATTGAATKSRCCIFGRALFVTKTPPERRMEGKGERGKSAFKMPPSSRSAPVSLGTGLQTTTSGFQDVVFFRASDPEKRSGTPAPEGGSPTLSSQVAVFRVWGPENPQRLPVGAILGPKSFRQLLLGRDPEDEK